MLMLWGARGPRAAARRRRGVRRARSAARRRGCSSGAGHFLQEDRGEDVGADDRRLAEVGLDGGSVVVAPRARWPPRAPRTRRGPAVGVEQRLVGLEPAADRLAPGARERARIWTSGPFERGTKTSKRGFFSAATTSVGDVLGLDRLHAASVGQAGGQLGPHDARHDHGDLDAGAAQLDARRPPTARRRRAWWRSRWPDSGKPLRPAIDERLTMWPVRRGTIRRIASWVPWMTACRLISSWRAMLSALSSTQRRDRHDPGVVDEHVERAEALLDLVEEGHEAGVVGDVERPGRARARRARRRSARPTRGRGRRRPRGRPRAPAPARWRGRFRGRRR